MKRTIVILVLLFTISLFAQEKKDNPKKTEIEQTYQTIQKKANELKAQVFDAEEFAKKGREQLAEFNKQMSDLQQQYQAILDVEKKDEVKK